MLLDKDETSLRDILIGMNNAKAVAKDLKGRSIKITSASLGSFLLKIDGIGGKFRVRRDK